MVAISALLGLAALTNAINAIAVPAGDETYSNSTSVESSSGYFNSTTSETTSTSSETTTTPFPSTGLSFEGEFVNGVPIWTLTVPGTFGPWTELSSEAIKEGDFTYTGAALFVNGIVSTEASISFTDDTISVVFETAVEETDVVSIVYTGSSIDVVGTAVTSSTTLSITTPDGKFVKRAVETWEFTSTITLEETSTSGGVTSTVTEDDISTTVITVTSCDKTTCTEGPVTTGVTVITTTEHGSVTEYTTYCPLPTHHETTVITITSCSEDKCHTTTSTKAPVPITVSTSTHESTKHIISTFEGVAQQVAVGSTLFAFVLSLMFI